MSHAAPARAPAPARAGAARRGAVVVERSVVVEAPADVVFDLLADVRNEARWNPNVVRIDVESPGPPRLGTRFTGRDRRGGRMAFEITGHHRPARLVFHGGGRWLRLVAMVDVSAGDAGTTVVMRAAMTPRGPLLPLAPLLRPLVERRYGDVPERFRAFVESARR
jgi:hypothetical protein